ncbi:MAG: tetratricopeptide repeat protein [Anaerolineae bacterium]
MTRSQRIIIIVLGTLTAIVCGFLATIFALNSQEIFQAFAPADMAFAPADTTSALATATLPLTPTVLVQTPTVPPTATASPFPTPTSAPTFTPTPSAPQTSYDSQIAAEPENPSLRLQRGYAYIEMGVYTDALEDFDLAIVAAAGMTETLAEAHTGRGAARFHGKEWSTALEDFNQALALNPDLANAHAWRGHLLSERGELELGIEALRQAVTLDETDPAKYIWLAQALLRNASPGEAKAAYSAALSLESHSVEAYIGQAMAEVELGDLDAAQVNLSHAMSTAPFNPVALNGRAWFYARHQQDRLFEAGQLAQQAVEGAKDDLEKARYLHTLGQIYYQQGYLEQAITTLEEAATLATIEGEVIYDEILEDLEEFKTTEG